MKMYSYLLCLSCVALLCIFVTLKSSNSIKVIKSITDERGLTSIQYVQGGDTLALDYLTPAELKKYTGK